MLHTYMNNSCRYSPQLSTTWVMSKVCYYTFYLNTEHSFTLYSYFIF